MTQQSLKKNSKSTSTATATELKWLKSIAKELTTISVSKIETELSWFSQMPAKRKLALGQVAASGIESFIRWYENPDAGTWVIRDIFGAAPRELIQSVTLQQTLQLTQVVVGVVEERVAQHSPRLKEATLEFSRDVAFAAAHVYASAAEARGKWDARLEALIVDSIITGSADDELASRVAALGWNGNGKTAALIGTAQNELDVEAVRRTARKENCDLMLGLQGSRLVLVFAQFEDAPQAQANQVFQRLTDALAPHFTTAPLVLGPTVPNITAAHRSARAALKGIAVAPAFYGVTYPVLADQLLPERVIAGDSLAKQTLLKEVYEPLVNTSGDLLTTLRSYLANGRSLEQTSRELFVHTNTVRYRLKRIYEILGWQPTMPRDAFVLQTALALGQVYANRPEQHRKP